jgi:hypothetical protein
LQIPFQLTDFPGEIWSSPSYFFNAEPPSTEVAKIK